MIELLFLLLVRCLGGAVGNALPSRLKLNEVFSAFTVPFSGKFVTDIFTFSRSPLYASSSSPSSRSSNFNIASLCRTAAAAAEETAAPFLPFFAIVFGIFSRFSALAAAFMALGDETEDPDEEESESESENPDFSTLSRCDSAMTDGRQG